MLNAYQIETLVALASRNPNRMTPVICAGDIDVSWAPGHGFLVRVMDRDVTWDEETIGFGRGVTIGAAYEDAYRYLDARATDPNHLPYEPFEETDEEFVFGVDIHTETMKGYEGLVSKKRMLRRTERQEAKRQLRLIA